MKTESITPAQYGAGALFAAVVLACIASGVHGTDLLAYLASATCVTGIVAWSDVRLRGKRVDNLPQVLRAKAVQAMAEMPAPEVDKSDIDA